MEEDLIVSIRRSIEETLSETCSQITDFFVDNMVHIVNTASFSETLRSNLINVLKPISDALMSLDFPSDYKERKQELFKAFELWGKFGWTPAPFMSAGFFNECPSTIKEADEKMLGIITKEKMDSLFDSLENECTLRNSDLREAILFYKNKHYKACAFYLFSIIDAHLISLQRARKGEKRKIGCRAVRELKNMTAHIINDEKKLFLPLKLKSIIVCLFEMYADTSDFRLKQMVINRNSLCHGMYAKKVRKKDCIKLFLVLHNFLDCLDRLSI